MDLLSLIGQVTKRKGDFFSQAESLASKVRTLDRLERKMAEDSRALVRALRDGEIRWDEYSRALADKTLLSALAAVSLGSSQRNSVPVLEKAWPTIVGEMLPPLVSFLDETEAYISNGKLLIGDQSYDFASEPIDEVDLGNEEESYLWNQDQFLLPVGESLTTPDKPRPKKRPSWKGVHSRVLRYLVTPTYSHSLLGAQFEKVAQGHKLMRRIAVHDSRTCLDCKRFEEFGWQAIGSIPLPGKECRCRDRCRCLVEYR